MNILVLDTAYTQNVVVIKDDVVAAEECIKSENHSDTFMGLIDSCLKRAKISINDIDCICINIGPGSFTGLRVAISIAKGLGVQSKIIYKTFTSFDYFKNLENRAIVLSGFSNYVYVRESNMMDCVEVPKLDINKKYVTNSNKIYEQLNEIGLNVVMENTIDYLAIIKKDNCKVTKIENLEPLYLRKSQAEIERDKRLKM